MKQILILLMALSTTILMAGRDSTQTGQKGDGDNSAWSGSSSLSGNGKDNGGVRTNVCQDNPTLPQCNPVSDNDNTNEPEPTPIPSEDNGLNDIQGAIETEKITDVANGIDGAKGDTGADGNDGKDADETKVAKLEAEVKKQNEFANDSAAGNMATSSIDFGSTAKGDTFIGAGVGVSNSWYGSSVAVGLGMKHGIEDNTAVILKAWSAGSSSYGAGLGGTYKF